MSSFKKDIFQDRCRLNGAIRSFFTKQGFLEVDTPLLTPHPIPETPIELFRTEYQSTNRGALPLFLVPSPEVWMKILLAQGAPSLFQISRCFRNGEQMSSWHRPEFTMLEWYSLDEEGKNNIPRMEELLLAVGEVFGGSKLPPSLRPPMRVISMEEAFRDYAGFSLEADLQCETEQIPGILRKRLADQGLEAPPKEEAADLFHRLFLNLTEPRLPTDRPLILKDWPALIPTLARQLPGTVWADRWELYLEGVEVANGYGEETDLSTLKKYWFEEGSKKLTADPSFSTNMSWPEHIGRNMPPCAGTALGTDRFLALLRKEKSLKGLEFFPSHAILGK